MGSVVRLLAVLVIRIIYIVEVPVAHVGMSSSSHTISPLFLNPFVPSEGLNDVQESAPSENSNVGLIPAPDAAVANMNSISSNFAVLPIITWSLSASNIAVSDAVDINSALVLVCVPPDVVVALVIFAKIPDN